MPDTEIVPALTMVLAESTRNATASASVVCTVLTVPPAVAWTVTFVLPGCATTGVVEVPLQVTVVLDGGAVVVQVAKAEAAGRNPSATRRGERREGTADRLRERRWLWCIVVSCRRNAGVT
ncbi:hypothetical protein GCM10027419_36250 [Pandoraea terrae]